MKKKYESFELEILRLETQDVITASVYIEWDDDWNGTGAQDGNWVGSIFG